MGIKIIYQDENVLVVDKPPKVTVIGLVEELVKRFPGLKNAGEAPRYGLVHRLDQDTSGVLLIAKTNEALLFLQKQFKEKRVEKKYLALVIGEPKPKRREIETLLGRDQKDRKRQKIYLAFSPESQRQGLRKAITEYQVINKFHDFSLLEVKPKTGRKHQIRAHLAYLGHPIAGDKLYGFKNQPSPKGLERQFLHSNYLKVELPTGKMAEFQAELPDDLKNIKLT